MTTEPAVDRSGSARATLAVSCAAPLLVLINYTAPLSTAGIIGGKLSSGASGQTWILSSIGVGLAAFLLVTGTLADDFGRKRIFVIGGGVFALGTVVCAVAPTTLVFVLGRIAQGAASAALLASSLGLLGHVFAPGPERARATGLWGAMVGAGIAVGPVLSALLIKMADWPTAYWIIAAVAVLVTTWAGVSLQESRSARPHKLDFAGVVILGAGLSFLVAALTEARGGWGQLHVLVFLAVALVLLVAFVWVERRAAEPMLDLSLLGRRSFLAATMGALVKGVGVLGFMIYLPSTVQRVLGISPLASAALLGVWSGVSFVAAPQARRLSGRVDARYQLAGGLALCGLGELALIGVGEHSSWWQLVPGLAVAGVGSGFANAALAGLAVHSVPANRVAMGSGANNTSRYIGASVGTALIAAVLAMAPRGGGPAHEFSIGMTHAAIVAGAVSILGAVFVAMCRERRGLEGVAEKTSALRRC